MSCQINVRPEKYPHLGRQSANILNTDKQITVIAALAEVSCILSIERRTGVHRDTIKRLGAASSKGLRRSLIHWLQTVLRKHQPARREMAQRPKIRSPAEFYSVSGNRASVWSTMAMLWSNGHSYDLNQSRMANLIPTKTFFMPYVVMCGVRSHLRH